MATTCTTKGYTSGTSSSSTLTLSSITLTSGNSIVVCVGDPDSQDISAVTWNFDEVGVGLSQVVTAEDPGDAKATIFVLHDVTGATGDVVVTWAGNTTDRWLAAFELSDSGVFSTDTSGGAGGNLLNPEATTDASVTQGDCICIACCATNTTISGVSGDADTFYGDSDLSAISCASGYEVHSTASGTLTATFTAARAKAGVAIAVFYSSVAAQDADATTATAQTTAFAATVTAGAVTADAVTATLGCGSVAATVSPGAVTADAVTAQADTGSFAATVTVVSSADAVTAQADADAFAATVTPGAVTADAVTAQADADAFAATVTPGVTTADAVTATAQTTSFAATVTPGAVTADAVTATADTTSSDLAVELAHPPTKLQLGLGARASIARLIEMASLEINSLTETPMALYIGPDARSDDWEPHKGYGVDLGIAGSGSDPTLEQGCPLFGDQDVSVKFNAGKYFEASSGSDLNISTEDFVFEAIWKQPSSERVASKLSDPGDGATGWQLYTGGANARLIVYDGGSSVSMWASTLNHLTAGAWYYGIWFGDRSENSTNGGRGSANGGAKSQTCNIYSITDIGNTSAKFRIGRYDGILPFNSNLLYLAVWKRAGWMQGGAGNQTEWASIEKERFWKLVDIWPWLAQGTARPNSFSRDSTSTISRYEGGSPVSYTVGHGWPTITEDKDGSGNLIRGWSPQSGETLQLGASDGNLGGSGSDKQLVIEADILLPDEDTASDEYLLSLSDGGSSADEVKIYVESSNDYIRAESAASGGNAGDATQATDVSDDTIHHVKIEYKPNYLAVTVDGSTGTPDTDCGIPDEIDRIDIGSDSAGANQFGGIISQLVFWQILEAYASTATADTDALAATAGVGALSANAVTAQADTDALSATVTPGAVTTDAVPATADVDAFAATVTAGAVTADAQVAQADADAFFPTVTPGAVTADAVTAQAQADALAATVDPGGVTANAVTAQADADAFAATVSTAANANAEAATAQTTAFAATVTPGAVTVDAATAQAETDAPAATVSPGAVTTDAATATAETDAPTATVTPGVTQAPAVTATAETTAIVFTVLPGGVTADAQLATAETTSFAATAQAITEQNAYATTAALYVDAFAALGWKTYHGVQVSLTSSVETAIHLATTVTSTVDLVTEPKYIIHLTTTVE